MLKIILTILLISTGAFNDVQHELTMTEKDTYFTKSLPFDEKYELVVTSSSEDKRLSVKYEVKDQDIYVECFVKDFNFSREKIGSVKREGEGHIHLYINGNKVDSIFQPSFIIRSLPSGTYNIKLDLIHNDYTRYGISEEFEITL